MLDKKQRHRAIEILKNNQIVIIPTDTIYGISAIISNENAQKINSIKNADSEKQLIILISRFRQLKKLGIDIVFFKKISKKMQNTTFILKTNNSDKTLAVRMVKRRDIKQIINKVGPIFSTSVNKHKEMPILDKSSLKSFDEKIKLFWDKESNKSTPSDIYNTTTKEWVRRQKT